MRVLIIEDEQRIANAVKEGLTQESFAVDICSNGQEGLNTALHEDYDAIILDRKLPDITDGIEICKALRAGGKQTPVIMLTAKDQVQDRVAGLNSGADDYLVKPFDFSELLARLHALLRRPVSSLGQVLTVKDLSVNTLTKEVKRARKTVSLSPKEYALLVYLLRNKNTVVSKQALINHVWEFDADILPSTVEVFIVYLRAKLEKPFGGKPIINTVRGFGYVIND
jgi:DNA-binding response OmpR family regulator